MLGTASAEIETFLLHTLGEKGVKKATSFVDTTYRKLLDLLALHLQSAAAALVHHSAQLAHDWAELSAIDDKEENDACQAALQVRAFSYFFVEAVQLSVHEIVRNYRNFERVVTN